MSFFLKFVVIFFIFLIVFERVTRKYVNPYGLYMVFGKKGSGKTTYLTKLAVKYIKKGYSVYSTVDIPNTYIFKPEWLGFFEVPRKSVLLIDEVGMIWDNRDFKTFKPEVRDWFKLQRQNEVIVYLFSQTFDVDKKLRDLTDSMYLLSCKARVFSVARRISKFVTINNQSLDSSGKLDEGYEFYPIFMPGAIQFTFIPRYIDFFDSQEMSKKRRLPIRRYILRDVTDYQLSIYSDKVYFVSIFKRIFQHFLVQCSLIKISIKLHKKSCNYYKNMLKYKCKRKGELIKALIGKFHVE